MFALHAEARPTIGSDGIEARPLCHGGSMTLIEFAFPRGARSKPHRHTHEQMGFVRAGRFEVYVGRESRILEPADSYYVPPGERHYAVALEDRSVLVDCFSPPHEPVDQREGE